jgi:hypothetical protein
LTRGPWAESKPLNPEDLKLGKARAGAPVVHFETDQQLVKRFKAVQQAKEEFWDRWVKEVFPSLPKQQKWYKYKRDKRTETLSSGKMRLQLANLTNMRESPTYISEQMGR